MKKVVNLKKLDREETMIKIIGFTLGFIIALGLGKIIKDFIFLNNMFD